MSSLFVNRFLAGAALFSIMLASTPARADLATALQTLNSEANGLNSHLASITLTGDAVCPPLLEANQRARALIDSIDQVDASLAAPLLVDTDVLTAIDQLFNTNLGIASEARRLSFDLQTLSTAAQAFTIKDGMVAMLQLSDDIGTMADRIGEMADKILVVSDNIGVMADRILVTQELQNQNVTLTMQSILQTQTNVLSLVSVVEDTTYSLDIANLITEGGFLATRMTAVMFSPWTMDQQLASVATDLRTFMNQVNSLNNIVSTDAAGNSFYVNIETLTQLGNLSLMLTSLATAVDGYVIAIGGLQAMTSKSTLSASLTSMLELSADIGVMSNRILEMADQILVMSDNIGLQADQIVVTQGAMNINVAMTQASILAAQEWAIGLIVMRNL